MHSIQWFIGVLKWTFHLTQDMFCKNRLAKWLTILKLETKLWSLEVSLGAVGYLVHMTGEM